MAAAVSYQATSVPLSPASGYHDLPSCFGFYGNHLFSEAYLGLFRPSLLLSCNLEVPFPPPSVKDYKGPFLPGWQGGWLWHIDWSVSLPLEGPFGFFFFFFFFWRVGVSFYLKASSLQVRAE